MLSSEDPNQNSPYIFNYFQCIVHRDAAHSWAGTCFSSVWFFWVSVYVDGKNESMYRSHTFCVYVPFLILFLRDYSVHSDCKLYLLP